MNTKYNRGRRAEWLAKQDLQTEGYTVVRAAGSKGSWDLIAVHLDHPVVRLIQVKSVKDPKQIKTEIKKFMAALPLPRREHFTQELWVYIRGKWHCLTA